MKRKEWIVTGTSMVVEAETEQEAVERAEQSSGWSWEARQVSGPHTPVGPTGQCPVCRHHGQDCKGRA